MKTNSLTVSVVNSGQRIQVTNYFRVIFLLLTDILLSKIAIWKRIPDIKFYLRASLFGLGLISTLFVIPDILTILSVIFE